jgi:hypothetical protein
MDLSSPYLFLFVMEAFDHMTTESIKQGTLKGLEFEEEGIVLCQDYYADNISMSVKGDLTNALKAKEICQSFGKLSGLYCKWSGTKANPMPKDLQDLD